MFNQTYERLHVPVNGGNLTVGRWGTGDTTIVAIHGVTASHSEFHALADALGDAVTLLAPDLRGRAGSRDLDGPYGMEVHADDVAATIRHLANGPVVVLGHSMGGFVAAVLAARYPDLVSHLVLVDGGLPLDLGPLNDLPIEELIHALIGPAMDRLALTFPSKAAYLEYWRRHPALADDWSAYIERYLADDLITDGDLLRPSCVVRAVVEDTESDLRDEVVSRSLQNTMQPVLHLRATRGLMNGDPLYTETSAAAHRELVPHLELRDIDDVNHYTILLSARGAEQVSAALTQFLSSHSLTHSSEGNQP